jgi:hypothetical protein
MSPSKYDRESKSCYTVCRAAIVSMSDWAHNTTGSEARGEGRWKARGTEHQGCTYRGKASSFYHCRGGEAVGAGSAHRRVQAQRRRRLKQRAGRRQLRDNPERLRQKRRLNTERLGP